MQRMQTGAGRVVTELPGSSAEDALLRRIRGEFLEMPGLRLTSSQASRLWNLDARTAQTALNLLVLGGFLRQTEDGQYMSEQLNTRRGSAGRSTGR